MRKSGSLVSEKNLPTGDIHREGYPIKTSDVSTDAGPVAPPPEMSKYSLVDLSAHFAFFLPQLLVPCMRLPSDPLDLFQSVHPEVPEASPIVLNAGRPVITNLHTVAGETYTDFWKSRIVMIVHERAQLLRGFLTAVVSTDMQQNLFHAVAGETQTHILIPRRGTIELHSVPITALAVKSDPYTWFILPDASQRAMRVIRSASINPQE